MTGRQNPLLVPAAGLLVLVCGAPLAAQTTGVIQFGDHHSLGFSRTEIPQVRQQGNLLLFWSEWELLLCCSLLLTRNCIIPVLLHPSNDAIFSIGRRQSAFA